MADPKSQGRVGQAAAGVANRTTRRWLRLCKRALVGTTVLFVAIAAINLYGALTHNPQGEYCRYVTRGEPFHIMIEGYPCRLTRMSAFIFFATYAVPALPLQGPLLLAWFVLRQRLRRVELG